VRWYWQLDYDSELTIVSLLCLPMALYTVYYLNECEGHQLPVVEVVLYT